MDMTTDFTVIGDEELQTSDLASAAPATVVTIDQTLFEELEEPWQQGEPVGEAHGTLVVTQKGLAVCHVTFTFGDEDSIVAHGVLPIDGSTIGSGHLAVAGGTGRFDKVSGKLDVETRNPKRWIFHL